MILNIVEIAALVLAITQVLKGLPFLSKLDPRILSVIVTILVILFKLLTSGKPFDLAEAISAILAVLAANGGFKLVKASTPA